MAVASPSSVGLVATMPTLDRVTESQLIGCSNYGKRVEEKKQEKKFR